MSNPTNLFRDAGAALYGSRWHAELARELDVADRTVRRWAAGEWPVPPGIWVTLRSMLRERANTCADLLEQIPE